MAIGPSQRTGETPGSTLPTFRRRAAPARPHLLECMQATHRNTRSPHVDRHGVQPRKIKKAASPLPPFLVPISASLRPWLRSLTRHNVGPERMG